MLIGIALVALLPAPALAHAERRDSRPAPGARLGEVPTVLEISFTEPPTGDTRLRVRDGCGDNVVASVDLNGTELAAQLDQGQPGRWEVSTAVVSGIDGHPTRDTWRFSVRGQPECSNDVTETASPDPDIAVPDDDSSGFPVLPFALGSVALIGLAFLVRRLST